MADSYSIFTVANFLDLTAIVTSLTYIYLIKQQKLAAWYFAFASSAIITYSNLSYSLYFFAVLNLIYTILAIYGFYVWRGKENGKIVTISQYNKTRNIYLVIIGIITSLIIYYIFKNNSNMYYSYIEIPVVIFSLIATYLQINKILASWIYFTIINFLNVMVYKAVGSYLLAVLFFIYFILSILGYMKWKKELKALYK